ncbi:sugar transferase [Parabacteroides sp. ZJ-118]|uniref:sugar transferase n=1 Tax=Parabacteroides sp. ZJ-118 TaxID=2709398 RepID=UPI0013EBBAA6|nr:sugar transferase [Parabacteroides sp. ZJ-118]
MKLYKRFFKRGIDVALSGCVLLVLAAPLAVVALWLHFANRGAGAFFFQERPGKGGKIFRMVKFKTMTDERDANGNLLPDAQRLTNVGRFVRSTSIDELPQLWNVFKGDMSLIGPRPLLPRYMLFYTEEELHRHDVRPGITGWAQCHGRNNVTWDDKLAMDVWYVNNVSFKTDLDILFTTIRVVIKRESVEVAGVEALDVYRQRTGFNPNNK